MALIVDLKPNERIIIANVMVRNGDRRTRLIFETEAKFLREKDMITVSEASTACEHLYILLQTIYFLENNPDLENRFISISNEIIRASPSTAELLNEILTYFTSGAYYQALKSGQRLIQYEKNILDSYEAKKLNIF